MTPSLARMVLSLCRENSGAGKVDIAALLPIKWFSIPQCWRFETTQRGRKREHYQWNMDIVGTPDIAAEVELLAAIVAFFRRLGIDSSHVGIKVNSRKVLGSILKAFGVSETQFAPVCVVIDKIDKKIKELGQEAGVAAIKKELCDLEVPEEVSTKILEVMDSKSV